MITTGILLFAQLGVAAYACPQLVAADAAAGPQMASGMPCAEMDAQQPNLCLEQAQFGKQSSDRHLPAEVQAAVFLYVLALPPAPADSPVGRIYLRSQLAHAGAPPLCVQYCCLRT